MGNIFNMSGDVLTKVIALKAGRFIWKKGGVAGIAVMGAAFLAYYLLSKKKEEKDEKNLTGIDDIEDNSHEVREKKKIVI